MKGFLVRANDKLLPEYGRNELAVKAHDAMDAIHAVVDSDPERYDERGVEIYLAMTPESKKIFEHDGGVYDVISQRPEFTNIISDHMLELCLAVGKANSRGDHAEEAACLRAALVAAHYHEDLHRDHERCKPIRDARELHRIQILRPA